MSNQILYIQRGNTLYNKNQGDIIGNRVLHSLGGIKQKSMKIFKIVRKKQQKYRIIPETSSIAFKTYCKTSLRNSEGMVTDF